MATYAANIANASLSSICDLPGIPWLVSCTSAPSTADYITAKVDYPSLIDVQNRLLDDLIGHSASGMELALNVKHAELATRDLMGVVRASNLSVKDALVDSLGCFVRDAQATGRHLQKLSAKVYGTMDSIAAFNAHAMRAITQGQEKGIYQAEMSLARTFQMSMDSLAAQVSRVLVAATQASSNLDSLEETLAIIHELCAREASLQGVAADELLWNLWTLLGGNRRELRQLKYRAEALQEIRRFRSVAIAYVGATSQALYAADAELSELRDRLIDASVGKEDIPIDVHLASIDRTLVRLNAERVLSGGDQPRISIVEQ
ncbi:hypothetical protein GY45DRAFT_1262527 [Cubamyces sp. BRFM 1775]|nr:hypothetical protein GY45DRAFT_1262527 [Cubamyces sp. BRFM 1775]